MGNPFILLVGGDFLVAYAAFALGAWLRFRDLAVVGDVMLRAPQHGLLLAVGLLFFSYLAELYRRDEPPRKRVILMRCMTVGVMVFFTLSVLFHFLGVLLIEVYHLLISILICMLLQFLWHTRCQILFAMAGLRRRAIVLGANSLARRVGDLMEANPRGDILVGYVSTDGTGAAIVPENLLLGGIDDLGGIIEREKPSQIVLAMAERRGSLPVSELLSYKLKGFTIVDAVSFVEDATGMLMLENINPSWFIFSKGSRITPLIRLTRRVVDIVFSTLGLIVSAPLMPLVALAVRLDSPGPVFFKQRRVGEGEREFLIYKFRTMRQDAEKLTGAVWSTEGDPRITKVGRFLRKTRLDEIPQLWNVFIGDMSFVGPRPERPEFVENLKKEVPYYGNRHCIKPGLTGWAQVRYPYGASVEDALAKLRYDLFYIKNYSVVLDLIIIVETVRVVLFGRGGR